jgi:hypothetical protein
VKVRAGDGYKGWPEHAPFDSVIVICVPEHIPQALIDQLQDGGRMIIPVGGSGRSATLPAAKAWGQNRPTSGFAGRFRPDDQEAASRGQTLMGCVKCKMRKTKSAVRNGETREQGVKSYPCGSAPVWKTLAEVLGLCQSERSQLRAAVMRRSDGAGQLRPDRRASPALTTSRVINVRDRGGDRRFHDSPWLGQCQGWPAPRD